MKNPRTAALRPIALLLLPFLLFTGCANEGKIRETSAPETTEQTEYIEESGGTVLFSDTVSHTIVVPGGCSEKILDLAERLRDVLERLAETPVRIMTDARGSDERDREILLANTSRKSSKDVIRELGFDDFAIRKKDGKIVIAAYYAENLGKAVEYFLWKMLFTEVKNGRKSVKMRGDCIHESPSYDLLDGRHTLSLFTVVYEYGNESAQKSAVNLAKTIKRKTGCEVAVKDDRAKETEYEIALGKAARKEAKSLTSGMSSLDCAIRTENKKILLAGKFNFSVEYAIKIFTEEFLSSNYSDTVRISSDYSFTTSCGSAIGDADDPALADGANLRVMSYNLLADAETVDSRADSVSMILLHFEPDVAGLQEAFDGWRRALDERLADAYAFVQAKLPSGKISSSALAYNIRKAVLIDCGVEAYSEGSDPLSQNLIWGRFAKTSDNKEYIVTSTQWDENPARAETQRRENAKIIRELYETYGCPVFAAGDYNSDVKSFYNDFRKETEMRDPEYCSFRVKRSGNTKHELGSPSEGLLGTDHIPTAGDCDLLFYNMPVSEDTLTASDHFPIYIDAKLHGEK